MRLHREVCIYAGFSISSPEMNGFKDLPGSHNLRVQAACSMGSYIQELQAIFLDFFVEDGFSRGLKRAMLLQLLPD